MRKYHRTKKTNVLQQIEILSKKYNYDIAYLILKVVSAISLMFFITCIGNMLIF